MNVNINELSFVLEDEVPYFKRTKWDDILHIIPKGQALILKEEQVKPESVRQALRRRQQRGQFNHLKIVVRGKKGEQITYIINPRYFAIFTSILINNIIY